MDIFNPNRGRKKKKKNAFDDETSGRVQFNVVIDPEIKIAVKEMAKKFRLNQSIVTEHLLQVALFYTNSAMKDEVKKNAIEKHLIDTHLLEKNVGDEEVMMRIGESNINWLLLDQSKLCVSRMLKFRKAMKRARSTENLDLYKMEERNLRQEVLKFTEWLFKLSSEDN